MIGSIRAAQSQWMSVHCTVYTVNEWVKKSIEQMTEEKYIWNWSTERQESQQLENKTIWNIRYLI